MVEEHEVAGRDSPPRHVSRHPERALDLDRLDPAAVVLGLQRHLSVRLGRQRHVVDDALGAVVSEDLRLGWREPGEVAQQQRVALGEGTAGEDVGLDVVDPRIVDPLRDAAERR